MEKLLNAILQFLSLSIISFRFIFNLYEFQWQRYDFFTKLGFFRTIFSQKQDYAFRHRQTNAAKTIKSGIILLRMLFSLKPKMP